MVEKPRVLDILALLVGKRERAGPGVRMIGLGGWSLEGLGKLVLSYTVKKQQPGGVWRNSSGDRPSQIHRP